MSENGGTWTVSSLKYALVDLDKEYGISCSQSEETGVLEVTLASAGDFVLYVSVGAAQVLTSAILWPREMQEDPAEFESMMLRSHKSLLPLCALSIDVIDGKEYYELFGAMSREASLKEIIGEFSAIADSALELARDIGPRAINLEEKA